MRLQTKLMLLICTMLTIVIVAITMTFHQLWITSLKRQIGTEALHLAKTIAMMREIRQAFESKNPTDIVLPIVESIRIDTSAEFIVVGDKNGIRIAHPIPDRIGKPMVGGDNEQVFNGQAIISEAHGSMGPSLRGKAPIYDEQGALVGVVSVGFLLEEISADASPYQTRILLIAFVVLVVGMVGSIFITRNVKRSIHGLEPEQIGRLYQEKETVLESVREGIIAVNKQGYITTMNQAAFELMGINERRLIGAHITSIFPKSKLIDVIDSGISQHDVDMKIGDRLLITNRVPILNEEQRVIGAVASFRNKSDLFLLTEQLSQLRNYADGLRAQTHEYSNKLHLIAGLIHLESYQDALDVISKESDIHQHFVQFIMQEIPEPIVGGLLIGKFNRANEVGVQLHIDPSSSFKNVPERIDRYKLVTIIGNLIDNGIEAVQQMEGAKEIIVTLTDWGEELLIEVEDTGIGISEEAGDRIFALGYTTKVGEHRGFGLMLVKESVEDLNGMLMYQTKEDSRGAVFTIVIPK